MQIDFSQVPDVENFCSVPEGIYDVRVAEVRQGVTSEGAPYWSLRLEVVEGEYAGRTAAWDSLFLGERGLRRARHVLSVLGFDVAGSLDLEADELLERRARVQVLTEEREDPRTGMRAIRPRVPYSGYEAA